MKVVFADQQKAHYPKTFFSSGSPQANPEVPQRADALLAAAISSGLTREIPGDYGLEHIAAIHSERYLHFFENIHTRWARIPGGSDEVIPGIQPGTRTGGYPKSAAGQAGWHQSDTACPIARETWNCALLSAHTASHAAHVVLDGEQACYALSRPPGHHASAEVAGGFCYLNNSAIAAGILRNKYDRVTILDIDVHHGNGTQDIFFERRDVLTVSIHADPVRFYPFFWGYADETGAGDGEGFNLNLPLPRGTADDNYLQSLDAALQTVADFDPGALVVALGLDAHEDDPFQGLAISTDGFRRIAERIGQLQLPMVLVQEGGYLSDALGANLSSCLNGFAR